VKKNPAGIGKSKSTLRLNVTDTIESSDVDLVKVVSIGDVNIMI
jgi:hypothetical protein